MSRVAVLALMLRLLRSRELSLLCLQMGGADLLLALPGRSYFPQNKGIVALALRRMLEDEVTLHSMMETEIKNIVAKLYRKQHPGSQTPTVQKVNMKQFMQACTPLICRDPLVYLKAFASTVRIGPPGSESSSLTSARGSQIIVLSSEERAKNTKLLSAHFAKNSTDTTSADKPGSQDEQPSKSGRGRSKSPQRALAAKSPKTKAMPKTHFQINGTPANHITSLLLKEIMHRPDSSVSSDNTFLSTLDYMDTLSDLVLAIPACGAAIHKFKPTAAFHNAISGCPDPPQTAVSYILHKLLPQQRSAPGQDLDKTLKSQAYNRTKLSQASARLVVCLVARAGEGRRRVISDLIFALSCSGSESPSEHKPIDDNEMWAISAWADLCLGLSAPKAANGSLTSQDSNSSLSFGVVKLMLEAGAPHALMSALERIGLHHPMASSVAVSYTCFHFAGFMHDLSL